jgi:hypothetical protein
MEYNHKIALIRMTQKNAMSDNAEVREYIRENNIPIDEARSFLPWNKI